MDAFKHKIHSAFKEAVNVVLPTRKESAFMEKGVSAQEVDKAPLPRGRARCPGPCFFTSLVLQQGRMVESIHWFQH